MVWIGLPILGFLIVNIRASHRFRSRLKRVAVEHDLPEETVPIVRAKEPAVSAALPEE